MTFKKWLSKYETISNPLGDIIRDIMVDPDFPISNNFSNIEEYLYSKISDENMNGLRELWGHYSASMNF